MDTALTGIAAVTEVLGIDNCSNSDSNEVREAPKHIDRHSEDEDPNDNQNDISRDNKGAEHQLPNPANEPDIQNAVVSSDNKKDTPADSNDDPDADDSTDKEAEIALVAGLTKEIEADGKAKAGPMQRSQRIAGAKPKQNNQIPRELRECNNPGNNETTLFSAGHSEALAKITCDEFTQ